MKQPEPQQAPPANAGPAPGLAAASNMCPVGRAGSDSNPDPLGVNHLLGDDGGGKTLAENTGVRLGEGRPGHSNDSRPNR
jgi:hypothetical protein